MLRKLSVLLFINSDTTFTVRLPQLSKEFQESFPHPEVPPLPRILSLVSMSMSKQTHNHFFASVMDSKKDLITIYNNVVLWMLKRDMLITLHLRIRVIATRELKVRVKAARDLKISRKGPTNRPPLPSYYDFDEAYLPTSSSRKETSFLLESGPRRSSRRVSSVGSGRSEISELNFDEDSLDAADDEENTSNSDSEVDGEDSGWDTTEDHLWPSMIPEPGKATPMQRRWLSAMSEGKQPDIARRFEL